MRICHVSPHLPPDQAANALLPAQLGRWMAERGDQVTFVAHEPGQGGAPAAGRGPWPEAMVRWIPRRKAGGPGRFLKIDAWRLMRQVHSALDDVAADAELLHVHSNGLIVEAAAAWARRRRLPCVLTLYGTEIWHYKKRWPIDLFTKAYMGADQITFYSQRLLERARNVSLDRGGLTVVYPPVSSAFAPRDAAARTRCRQALDLREQFVVLNVKRLHPLAGQRFLLDAFAQLCA